MPLVKNAKLYLAEIKEKWKVLQETPGVFAYKLNVTERKLLPGQHQFYTMLNPERSTLRRPPQEILTLDPKFDNTKFNFTKINKLEVLAIIPYDCIDVSMIINKSPLTLYHTLISPDMAGKHVQRITPTSLSFCVNFLLQLQDKTYRIGYNSPGALASVNHLHFQLLHLEQELYVDIVKLELLKDKYIYRHSTSMPTEAICFLIYRNESSEQISFKLLQLYDFIMWLCEEKMPHNLFMTPTRDDQTEGLKVFIYARSNYCAVKDYKSFNVGLCELAGFITVGDKKVYDGLTEQQVIEKIRDVTGNAYTKIYKYFTK